jgi:hypothetical protein
MPRATLLARIFWGFKTTWHLRRQPAPHELSVQDTVKGLQTLLLAEQGAMLAATLEQAFGRPVALDELDRLDISLYQEGADQRVWRAQATLAEGIWCPFGIIVARAPTASNALTQRDFHNLQVLHARQQRYCVQPYVCGTMPVAGGVTAYTVEWLDQHKELVFEITRRGGVFLVNARGAHRLLSPKESRQIWRRLVAILWWYAGLRQVNIQAGDFVGHESEDGQFDLKLTTAREVVPGPEPAEHLHTILRSLITASGYLSDGRRPFDRCMSEGVFRHRMQAVLQRRFGDRAADLAGQQWVLFQQGAFARQEDWLKQDCILATYDRLRAAAPAGLAWRQTRQYWMAYANAIQAGRYAPSWWFPAADIPVVLEQLAPPPEAAAGSHGALLTEKRVRSEKERGSGPDELREDYPAH